MRASDVAIDIHAGRDLDQFDAAGRKLEHGALGDVERALAALARRSCRYR